MESVQILLSTYNGEMYLDEQIESLINQVGVSVSILARDDGSKDSTTEILSKWKEKGVLNWFNGPNLKPAKSFWKLIKNTSNADYYAFCDQDDIWDSDKLKVAIEHLKKFKDGKPALYYSKLNPVDENLNSLKYRYRNKNDRLERAMVVSFAAGCTMVFNKQLLDLAKLYEPSFLRMHDHWIYLLCTAIGGEVVYDPIPHIKYRQHKSNTVGIRAGMYKQVRRLWNSYTNGNRERWMQIKELFDSYSSIITKQNLQKIQKVVNYSASWKNKIALILDNDIKSGSKRKDVMFIIAVLTGKF